MAVLACLPAFAACHTPYTDKEIHALIRRGEFTRADATIADRLALDTSLTPLRVTAPSSSNANGWHASVWISRERGRRCTRFIREVDAGCDRRADYRRWEASGALEMMVIDGEKCYFNSAARNLFRIDSAARRIWREKHRDDQPSTGLASESGLDAHSQRSWPLSARQGRMQCFPSACRSNTRSGSTPMPYRRVRWSVAGSRSRGRSPADRNRSRFIGSDPSVHHPCRYVTAPADDLSGTPGGSRCADGLLGTLRLYLVRSVLSGGSIRRCAGHRDPGTRTVPARGAAAYHVSLRNCALSPQRSSGTRTNPVLIARRLFAWMDRNIPWASAREYSTVPSLSGYAFANRHGDCGMQTMLFITLLRLNGIPARWQSGWEFRPPEDSMHDWGMVYFAPYGWVPMDVDVRYAEFRR